MTAAPVAEAASSRSSSRVPDHAPEAFIRHDGKVIFASVVHSPGTMFLLIRWPLSSADAQDRPTAAKSPVKGAYSTVVL
jgi:hypothetical protein